MSHNIYMIPWKKKRRRNGGMNGSKACQLEQKAEDLRKEMMMGMNMGGSGGRRIHSPLQVLSTWHINLNLSYLKTVK